MPFDQIQTLPNDDDILKRLGGPGATPSTQTAKPSTTALPSDDEILKSLTDDEVLKRLAPAPTINVGAPNRPLTQDELNATEPWRQKQDAFDVRKWLPRDKKSLATTAPSTPSPSPNSNQSLIDALNNPVQGPEISSITNKPVMTLAEQAGGQAKLNESKARFKQQQQIRENAFNLALKASPENRPNALRALAKLGPISTNEQQQLGIDSHYLQSFLRPLWAESEEIVGGIARPLAAIGIPGAKTAYQHLSDAAVEDRLQANIHGERGYLGDILQVGGEILPQAALAGRAPSGLASDLAFPAAGMLASSGRGEDAEHIIKAGLANAIPIAGSKVFVGAGRGLGKIATNSLAKAGLEFGSRAAPNIALNEVIGGMSGVNDEHGILTNALMASVMSLHGEGRFNSNAPESKPSLNRKGEVPESSPESIKASAAINSDDLQAAIAQHFANPSPESIAHITVVGQRIGLHPQDIWNVIDATSRFKDSLSQKGPEQSPQVEPQAQAGDQTTGTGQQQSVGVAAGASSPVVGQELREGSPIPATIGGNENAAQTGIIQQGSVGEHQGTPQGQNLPANQGEVRATEGQQTSGGDSTQRETQGEIVPPTPQVGQPLTHSDPDLHGRPIVSTTQDGRAIVPNANNKGGVSVVKDQTPPPEPPPSAQSTTPPKEEFITGIKNAQVEAERRARGLPEIESTGRLSDPDAWDQAQQDIKDGKINIRAITPQWAEKPRPLTKIENAALLVDRVNLHNEHTDAMTNMEAALKTGDPVAIADAKAALLKVEADISTNDLASRRSGTENALGLQARQMMAKQDYTLDRMVQRYNIANNGEGVPDDIRSQMAQLVKERDAAVKALDDHLAKTKTSALDKTIETIKRKEQFSTRKGERAQRKAALDVEFQQITREFNSAIGGLHAGIPVDALPALAKMVRNRVQAGVVTVEGLVDAIHETIKDQIEGLSKEDVLDALNQIDLNYILDEKRQNQGLKSTKTRLINRQAELDRMAQSGEFYKNPKTGKETLSKPRNPIALDKEALDLKAKMGKTTEELRRIIKQREYQNRSGLEKTLDTIAAARRFQVLGRPSTLLKLTAAASWRMITSPIEEVIGTGLGKLPIIRKVSEGAPRQGGFSFKAEAEALRQIWDKGSRTDIKQAFKTGETSLDFAYGHGMGLPPELLGMMGRVHAAFKVIPKRAEFFRSFQKRAEAAAKSGLDIGDPTVQATIGAQAYLDANRAIFLQDNAINTGYTQLLHAMERSGDMGKGLATGAKVLMPIVKVPTNYIGEGVGEYGLGALKGGVRILYTGLKSLTPDQRDTVMRAFKKQGLGAAMLAVGYFAPKALGVNAGGYYQQGEKRKSNAPGANEVGIGGVNIPHLILHSPPIEAMQFGATLRNVEDAGKKMNGEYGSNLSNKSKANSTGIAPALGGALTQVPFLQEPARIKDAMSSDTTGGKFMGDLIRTTLIPPMFTEIAEQMDRTKGKLNKRQPKDFKQTLEMGVPGLRKKVPLKKKQ